MYCGIWRGKRLIRLPQSLSALAQLCDGEIVGDGSRTIQAICSLTHPKDNALAFVGSSNALQSLRSEASVNYIVKPDWCEQVEHGIIHDNPQQAFRQVLVALTAQEPPASIASTATIHSTARVGEGVYVGENCVIGEWVTVGDGCRIGANTVIEADVVIGAQTKIGHQVTIHHDTRIGQQCVIGEGAVIGGQGFGFSLEGGQWQAIPQIGRTVIGDAVHIGANSCIDRGAIDDTRIGNNVIIDNLVHIAHNVQVGDGTAMAAGVGIAGSTVVGKHCLLAGQVGVVGHICIADGVQVNGGARVLKSLDMAGAYAGSFHVMPANKWNRALAYFKRIETLFKREKS